MSDKFDAASMNKKLEDTEELAFEAQRLDTTVGPPSWWEPCSERSVSCTSLDALDSVSTVLKSVQQSLKNSTISRSSESSVNQLDESALLTDFSDDEENDSAHEENKKERSVEEAAGTARESSDEEAAGTAGESSDEEAAGTTSEIEEEASSSTFSTSTTSTSDSSSFDDSIFNMTTSTSSSSFDSDESTSLDTSSSED